MVITSAYNKALKEAFKIIKCISIQIDPTNDDKMLALIKTSISTKLIMRWSNLMCKLALEAMRIMAQHDGSMKTIDIKQYARVENVLGGEIEQNRVLNRVMLNKDITHVHMWIWVDRLGIQGLYC